MPHMAFHTFPVPEFSSPAFSTPCYMVPIIPVPHFPVSHFQRPRPQQHTSLAAICDRDGFRNRVALTFDLNPLTSSTKFGVDSSSRFPFRPQTPTYRLPYPTHRRPNLAVPMILAHMDYIKQHLRLGAS